MKQPLVLFLGIGSLFGPLLLGAAFDLELRTVILLALPISTLGVGAALYLESKNVKSGKVDLTKQSKGNKILTYTLAFLFILIFVGPIIYKIMSDLYG